MTAVGRPGAGARRPIEWPTLWLLAATYGLFGLLTWFHDALAWWLLLPLGAYTVCLHGSLQHEAVHGHPTPRPRLNEILVLPSLWLWMPFRLYRETHLTHHDDAVLTDPLADPESYYVTPAAWDALGPFGRVYHLALNSLLGRLALGPLHCAWRLYRSEAARLLAGQRGHLGAWLWHFVGCALVLLWVLWACRMPLIEYLGLFAYPAVSLTLLRSFLEHQARAAPGERSVLIEAGGPMALLYLNNNLHALHHAEPGLAWYRLPARYKARRAALLARNGNYFYRGYGEVVARYLLWPKEPPAHPLGRATMRAADRV